MILSPSTLNQQSLLANNDDEGENAERLSKLSLTGTFACMGLGGYRQINTPGEGNQLGNKRASVLMPLKEFHRRSVMEIDRLQNIASTSDNFRRTFSSMEDNVPDTPTLSIFDDNTLNVTSPQVDRTFPRADSFANASILSLASEKFDRQPAQQWPCRRCGFPLGATQIVVGVMLVVFDVGTNTITHVPYAITTGILMIIVGMLTLIASARFDRTTMYAICAVTTFLMLMCILLFVHSVKGANLYCRLGLLSQQNVNVTVRLKFLHTCGHLAPTIHIILIIFSLFNGFMCAITLVVFIRSLRGLHALRVPYSPLSALLFTGAKNGPQEIMAAQQPWPQVVQNLQRLQRYDIYGTLHPASPIAEHRQVEVINT